MARTKNPQAVAEKQQEILNAFQRLIYTEGYENVSVQNILDGAGISKGALYHYFESKQAMLAALLERMLEQGEAIVGPIARMNLPANEKLSRMFVDAGKWKVEHSKEVFAVLSAWYAPENDIVRYRMRNAGVKRYRPYFEAAIAEGVDQGIFAVTDCSSAATIMFSAVTDLSDTLSNIILDRTMDPGIKPAMLERLIGEYTAAIGRLLGAPAGTVKIIDEPSLRYWAAFAGEYPSEA